MSTITTLIRIGGECDLHGPFPEKACPECGDELAADLETVSRQGRVVTITANGGQQ